METRSPIGETTLLNEIKFRSTIMKHRKWEDAFWFLIRVVQLNLSFTVKSSSYATHTESNVLAEDKNKREKIQTFGP